MNELLAGLRQLGPGRLIAMAAVGVGILGLMILLMLRGSTQRMALLYSDLDLREAAQIAEHLDRQHIAHQVGAGGTEILVPDTQVGQARLSLAHEGLPSGGGIGYEIFDRGDGLVAGQFQQAISQTRALEGELSRTIRGISGVRAARVHLVLPRREPFSAARTEAQASVLLTLAGPGRIDREAIQAISTLVAAAVPSLRPQNVAVIDSRGALLARAGQDSGMAGAAEGLDQLRRGMEIRLARAVEDMLEPSLGPGRVRAEAAVDFDFDQVRETEEKFDPEGQVVRGAQNVTASSRSTEPGGATTVQNNLPNADAGGAGGTSQDQKQEETTNYEVGKTVRTLIHDQPRIRRISLAVMVDGSEARDDKGALQWKPRSPDDIERISTLVRGAIGFDAKRGDRVDVVTMRFASEEPAEPGGAPLIAPLDKADILRLGETGILGLVAVLALLLVLRPMIGRLTSLSGMGGTQALDVAASGGLIGGAPVAERPQLLLEGGAAGGAAGGAMSAAMASAEPGADGQAMISLGNVEGQLRASSIRRIIELVERHPEESLAIVRAWMHQEPA